MGATQPATFGGGTLEPPMTKVNPEVSCHTVDELPEEMEDVDKYGNAYF